MAPLLAQKPGVDRVFERLYRRYALDVYRYAYAVLRNQSDAEDVAQTTFMNAYRALERGETVEAPHNWLIAIAHNVCRQRFRQQSRRVQEVGLDVDVADVLVGAENDDTPTPEDINRALGHLAFNQRAALVMRELEGRSYVEIADLLDLSVSAVETLLFRARRALREQLEVSITCGQAEQFLSRKLDSALSRGDRSQLRAHVRECAPCRKLARSQRAQRSALKALGAVPLPSSLASLFGGGGAAVATKVAAVVVATGVAGGISYDAHRQLTPPKPKPPVAKPIVHPVRAAIVRTPLPVAAAVVAAKPARPHPVKKAHVPAQPVEQPRVEQPDSPQPDVHAAEPGQPEQRVKPEHGHGHEAKPKPALEPEASANPALDSAPGKSGDEHGKRDQPHGKDGAKKPELQPALPPLPAPPGLTQTSQNDGARNGPEWHLHP